MVYVLWALGGGGDCDTTLKFSTAQQPVAFFPRRQVLANMQLFIGCFLHVRRYILSLLGKQHRMRDHMQCNTMLSWATLKPTCNLLCWQKWCYCHPVQFQKSQEPRLSLSWHMAPWDRETVLIWYSALSICDSNFFQFLALHCLYFLTDKLLVAVSLNSGTTAVRSLTIIGSLCLAFLEI